MHKETGGSLNIADRFLYCSNILIFVKSDVLHQYFIVCRGRFEGRSTDDPAVVLLDLKMPKVDGLEVLREIRSDPRLKRIPVVVLTSSSEESDVVQSYELGTNAFVVKPVDSEQFAAAIRELGLFWAVLNEPPPGSE